MDTYFLNHIKDLSERTYASGVSAFSVFLTPEEQSAVEEAKKELIPFELFGGHDGCERKLIRFGSETTADVLLPFPIVIIKAQPLNEKFSDELTHRDYLGALMNLGIDRSNTGDIILRKNTAFIFVLEEMADYICDNLTKVKHTTVSCERCDELPEGDLFRTEEKTVIVSSMRLDCIISAVLNISRSKCSALFSEKKVYVDSKQTENTSFNPDEGAIVSVRGSGRFRILDITGNTKKGRIVLNIAKYI